MTRARYAWIAWIKAGRPEYRGLGSGGTSLPNRVRGCNVLLLAIFVLFAVAAGASAQEEEDPVDTFCEAHAGLFGLVESRSGHKAPHAVGDDVPVSLEVPDVPEELFHEMGELQSVLRYVQAGVVPHMNGEYVEVALKGLGHVETGCVPAGFIVHESMDEEHDVLPLRLLKIDPRDLLWT